MFSSRLPSGLLVLFQSVVCLFRGNIWNDDITALTQTACVSIEIKKRVSFVAYVRRIWIEQQQEQQQKKNVTITITINVHVKLWDAFQWQPNFSAIQWFYFWNFNAAKRWAKLHIKSFPKFHRKPLFLFDVINSIKY